MFLLSQIFCQYPGLYPSTTSLSNPPYVVKLKIQQSIASFMFTSRLCVDVHDIFPTCFIKADP